MSNWPCLNQYLFYLYCLPWYRESFDQGFEDYSSRKETSVVSRVRLSPFVSLLTILCVSNVVVQAVQIQLTGEVKGEDEGIERREEEQHERTAKVLSIVERELETQVSA